jgi:hypothetical protein
MVTQTSKKGRNGQATSKITKVEGLRRALAKLGQDANTDDLQSYIKKHFGLEMSKDHIYVSKGDIRKKDAKKAAAQPGGKVEPATKPAEPTSPTTTHAGNGATNAVPPRVQTSEAGAMTKMDGVRRALQELGKNATPTVIQPFLMERFGIQMSREGIKGYKNKILTRLAGKKKAQAKGRDAEKKVSPRSREKPAPSLAVKESDPKAIRLEDILMVKDLVGRVGLVELRTLVDVLTR